MTRMLPSDCDGPSGRLATLYIASRLPELSETFVYREMLGLRALGRPVIGASLRKPKLVVGDEVLEQLAREILIIYAPLTYAVLPLALALHPALLLRALGDALTADHPNLSSRLKHVLQAAMGIATAWRLRRFDIGHVHAHMANAPAMIGLYVARALGARFSFTGHANDLFVQRAALRFKLDNAHFVACISRWHHDLYGAITTVAADRRPVIRCSVAIPPTVLGQTNEIVTVARLVPKKGVDLLIRAFVAANLPGWTLRILGDGVERERLEGLSRELGGQDRIVFEGAQPHRTCLHAIAAAGLFVLPCRTAANGDKDGIPVVLMEAMAAARAVIAGDLPAIRELVDDGTSGLLVAPNDEHVLATTIRLLALDPDRRAALGLSARQRIAAEFSDPINLARMTAAIDDARAAP